MYGFDGGVELEERVTTLPVPMTEAEKVQKGAELVEALAAANAHDRTAKETAKALRDQSEHLWSIVNGIARELKTGEMLAEVKIVDILTVATKEVATVRTDTGIVVGTRKATIKELSLTLPFDKDEAN